MANHRQHIENILKNGVARTNRYRVIIPLPDSLLNPTSNTNQDSIFNIASDILNVVKVFHGGGNNEITRGLELSAYQSEIPGKNITTTDIRYNGDFYKLPYSIVYGMQPLTFLVSQDMYEKNILDVWMDKIYNPYTHEIGYMSEYATNIIVEQLDVQDNVVYSVTLEDAYPVTMNPLTQSNEEFNNYHRLFVMFAYRKWYKTGEKSSGNGLVDALSETPLGPYVTPILSNPVVQRALEYTKKYTGVDLEGEAVEVYNQVDGIVRSTTGESINKTVSLIEGIKAATEVNDRISNEQKARILDYIDGVLSSMKG